MSLTGGVGCGIIVSIPDHCLPFYLKIHRYFCCKNMNAKATHIFPAKNINVLAIFQDRNFNVMLAVKF